MLLFIMYFYLFDLCPDVKMSPVLFGVILANAVVMLESHFFTSFVKFFKYDLILASFFFMCLTMKFKGMCEPTQSWSAGLLGE